MLSAPTSIHGKTEGSDRGAMAWVEDETWVLEQGVDGLLTFELFADEAETTPWQFTGYDVNATIADLSGRTVYPVTVDANPATGTVRLIALEATVAQLRPGRPYRYDCLMVAPGATLADDQFLAAGTVTVAKRSSQRDP